MRIPRLRREAVQSPARVLAARAPPARTRRAEVGLSRSALYERFVHFIGQPPMQYLARWRLTIAAQRLRNEKTTLAHIAADSGYDSEAAFNRAFKRALGTTPAAWRRGNGNRGVRKSRSTH